MNYALTETTEAAAALRGTPFATARPEVKILAFYTLGECLRRQGKLEEAERELGRALEEARRWQPHNVSTLRAEFVWGHVQHDKAGNSAEGKAMMGLAVKRISERFGADFWMTCLLREALARVG